MTAQGDADSPEEASNRNDNSGNVGRDSYQFGSVRDSTVNIYQSETSTIDIPNEIPGWASPFVNRGSEMSQLDTLTAVKEGAASPIVVVEGTDEVGKTALMAKWADQAKAHYPDGMRYVDFAPNPSRTGTDLDVAIDHLLGNVDGENREFWPSDVHARAGRWRTIAASRRMLIVLDNLETPALLAHLRPNSPSSVIAVVTRYNTDEIIATYGAEVVEVSPLSDNHSLDLLRAFCEDDRIDADRDTALRLIGLCNRNLRTIRVVGARLKRRPQLDLVQACAQLEDASSPSRSVAAVATDQALREGLDAFARKLFAQLGAHPGGDFGIDLAAWLGNGAGDPAHALRQLESAQLITSMGKGRWRIPAPFKETPNDDAVQRVLQWYRLATRYADEVIMDPDRLRVSRMDTSTSLFVSPPSKPSVALDWFDAEFANVVAVQRFAHDHGHDRLVWELEESLWALYMNRKRYPQWNETSRLAMEAAEHDGNRDALSRMLAQRARYLYETGDVDAALDHTLRARDLARGTNNRRLEASAVEFAGRFFTSRRQYGESMRAYRFALDVNIELGHRRAIALIRHELGTDCAAVGQVDTALELLRASVDGFADLGSHRNRGRVLVDLATILASLDRLPDAMASFDAAIATLDEAGSSFYVARAREQRGDVLAGHHQRAQAITDWQAALDIHVKHHNGDGPQADRLRERLRSAAA
ncbi:MAG TPA: tetratricopeptide repeat protein [Stackebrandtia sp.]|uniref:tetratricopeptide repeat protein n=1 Tax=Stackebrandtia sp. TaxID=2023065 RepID=UPI002D731A17|nr:tetratricopeptide repeat protein [Stackebrandtia sp.]HZE39660.1 tetratricopeptide repeat protein [Stackebrandtia sp.]